MKKKLILIIGIFLIIVFSLLIILPYFYKDAITEIVKEQANKNLNANIDFKSVGINVLRHFPNLSVSLEKLIIVNNKPFEGDTLASIDHLKIVLNLFSLLIGNKVSVNSVIIDQPTLKFHVLPDQTTNWHIIKPSEEENVDQKTQSATNFEISLHKYIINNGIINYTDEFSGIGTDIRGFDHEGAGDFSQNKFELATKTSIQDLSIQLGGINYLNHVHTQLTADFFVDNDKGSIAFKNNELKLNEFGMQFDGFLDTTMINVQFKTNRTDFKEIISLIPSFYSEDFSKLKTSGEMFVEGSIQGNYSKENFPGFKLLITTKNGNIQHSQTSTVVKDVNLNLKITNPGGALDKTVIDLDQFHAKINQDPLDLKLQLKTPITDPEINLIVNGKVDLKNVNDLLAVENKPEISGFISSDLQLKGKLSDLKNLRYANYSMKGNTSINNFALNNPELSSPLFISQADLIISTEKLTLNNFQAKLGESDFQANGSLENMFPFLLDNKPLNGLLTLNSNLIDLNPFMEGPSQQLEAIELPANINFTFNSNIGEIRLGNMLAKNVFGYLTLKDGILRLVDLNMNILDGSVKANGSYQKVEDEPANSVFDLQTQNISFTSLFDNFLTVRQFVPIAHTIQGTFDGRIGLSSNLDSLLMPELTSLSSQGNLVIQKATIKDFKPLSMLADLLKIDKIKQLVVENIKPSYEIKDGRFHLNPLTFSYQDIEFLVSGSNGIDKSIDYQWKLKIPAKELGQQSNAYIDQIFKRKVDLLQDDAILIDVLYDGTIDKPNMKVSGNNVVKSAKEKLTDMAKQQIEEKKSTLTDSVASEIEKLKRLFKKK